MASVWISRALESKTDYSHHSAPLLASVNRCLRKLNLGKVRTSPVSSFGKRPGISEPRCENHSGASYWRRRGSASMLVSIEVAPNNGKTTILEGNNKTKERDHDRSP